MTKQNAKDFLPLVQALAEGKTIQVRTTKGWSDFCEDEKIAFDCDLSCYRVKPQPREWWIVRTSRAEVPYPDEEKAMTYFLKEQRYHPEAEIIHVREVL